MTIPDVESADPTLDRCLSPRLASQLEDNEELRDCILASDVLCTQDLGSLALDVESAIATLEIPAHLAKPFQAIFTIAKACAEGEYEKKMYTMLDVLNSEGQFIMSRPRYICHRDGFWHRAVNCWVLCVSTERVLMGQRAATKDIDPNKWTCVCGRVESGELSMSSAVDQLKNELSIKDLQEDTELSLAFSMKSFREITSGVFAGQRDATWLDVYIAQLQEEIPIEKLLLDVHDKEAVRYVSLAELHHAYETKNPEFVQPVNQEYVTKLFRYLRITCQAAQGKKKR